MKNEHTSASQSNIVQSDYYGFLSPLSYRPFSTLYNHFCLRHASSSQASHAERTITSDKLMLSRQELAVSWGESKQKAWGQLTNAAILLTSNMIKKGQFDNMKNLHYHMVGLRQTIGAILNHDHNIGELRDKCRTETPIDRGDPTSPYRALYPEFQSWLTALKNSWFNRCNVSYEYGGITLMGTHAIVRSRYPRSTIREQSSGGFVINHTDHRLLPDIMEYADSHLQALMANPNMSPQEKRQHTEAIFFYLADGMPCSRGSAAIAQMLFFSVEDAFIGQMRCLNKLASQYGHNQGVTPDIAAMLSPTLPKFQAYLNDYIIDQGVTVTKCYPATEINVDSDILQQQLKSAKEASKTLYKPSTDASVMHPPGREPLKLVKESFAALYRITKKCKANRVQLELIHFFVKELIQSFSENHGNYYAQFYLLLSEKDTSFWPNPITNSIKRKRGS